MRIALGLAGLVACTPIYDAQYNDRANELEELRKDFRPESDDTALLASGGNRVFWVATKRPEDQTFMHSMIPGDQASELVYSDWSKDLNDFEGFKFGDTFIADCSFSSTRAFGVNLPGQTSTDTFRPGISTSDCAVDGNTIWVIAFDVASDSSALFAWNPGTTPPGTEIPHNTSGQATVAPAISFEPAGIAGQVAGFSVIGDKALAVEQDGDLYAIDLTAGTATYLNNDEKVVGTVFFDTRGALYETQNGPRYIEFDGTDDPPDTSFDDMVADGGYHLNFKLGDIQQPSGNGEYFIHGRHVVYRGQRGIFAYGLDTHNVVDLLLDRGEGIDLELAYHQPTITTGNQLFVFGTESLGIGFRGPVFQVDLNDRLK